MDYENFKDYIDELRKQWYFVLQTDDGDRYYREVYADGEMVFIASSEEEAYMMLWKIVVTDLVDN